MGCSKPKPKQKQNRREYHRMRYQNLSQDKKKQRIHQIRSSLEKKINSLDADQLDQYHRLKKQRDSTYYYNAKVKASLKGLEDLHISTSRTRRGEAFGEMKSLVSIPSYVNKVLRSFGGNLLPGGNTGCFVSVALMLFLLLCLFIPV